MKTLSVIIPVFNEVHFGPNIVRVMDVLERSGIEHEIILVDDGSTNGAWNEIADLVARHGNATGISLSRNFGKEAALCAGLEHCTGDCAVCLDSDMQFPPEAIPAMYRLWEEGYEVVEGVKRERQHEGVVYRLCAGAFYTALRKLAGIDLRNASDFRLLDRAVVDALLGMPERQTFFRGMSSWVGFRRIRYEFDVSDREEGRSKWSARGLFRLAVVIEKIVPFMAVLYLLGGLAVLAVRIDCLPETFACIFRYAFSPEALLGGGLGHALKTAVSQGIKRGLFSNEAGMGSTPHAHALANVPTPHNQGTAAMIGVFIDTCVVLTMTALIIISTIYTGDGPLAKANGETYREMLASSGLNQSNLVQYAISSVSSTMIGNVFVAICLLFFAFSTILSWNLFGRLNVDYLLGKKALKVYSILSVAVVFIGTVLRSELVWSLQDLLNQLMVVPNVIALTALSGAVAQAARKR